MVPCPWFRGRRAARARAARRRPRRAPHAQRRVGALPLGAGGRPLARCPRCSTPRATCRARRWRPCSARKPEEVEIELRAQIESALAAGIDVTHLDAHMGTVLLPAVPRDLRAARARYRLPVFAVRPDDAALRARRHDRLRGRSCAQLVDALDAAGVPILDGFDANSLHFAPGDGERAQPRAGSRGLGPGVNYLICHPAQAGEELDGDLPGRRTRATSSAASTAARPAAARSRPRASTRSACARCAI